ncbi:C-myc promoter-binding protein isoform X2 [Planococcus citri]|uniref:C-myc promoter-binding protein isoform X2 n=1 Tax=Planococcus citri TaxID=170843 RepID=UPI0031FA3F9B
MDERQIADYFVVAGLPESESDRAEEDSVGNYLKQSYDPITDLAVIFPTQGETIPPGFTVIKNTPTGIIADLNHGSLRSPEVFLCFRRGKDKPPLVDIGIMYEGKERILPDSEILLETPTGRCANVNNSSAKTFVTYRRAQPTMPCNALVVTDICVINVSKGEVPPHAFCIINKNLNKGIVGSEIYLCYKKSMNQAPAITYKPAILSRYPITDKKSFPLPQSVPLFCLPMGATLEVWPFNAQQPAPVFSTFVLTVSDAAQKVYGSALTFYEEYPEEKVNEKLKQRLCSNFDNKWDASDDNQVSFHVIKCICLLSHWPFFDAFERFLNFLYQMSREASCSVPIERYILHFMGNVPFPSIQRPRILVQLSPIERLILTQPEDLPLPRSGAGFHQMLMNLGPDNCLLLLLCALTEQKLLIHSLRPDVLTAVAEAVSMIIFPFKWQCPYIPLCPLSLAEVLHAPVPFLIGVDSRFFDLYDPPPDVNCVDLDTNNITVCEKKRYLTSKLLPKKAARNLRNSLELTYQKLHSFLQMLQLNANNKDLNIDKDFQLKRKEQSLELEIQEAFLKFMVHILKGYRSYLMPLTKAPTIGATDTNSLFDLQSFLRSRDRSYQKFYSMITHTQMFIRFIEERSFVSDLEAGLAFFDECIEKGELDESDVHLLELDESHQSERTVFVSPPENNLPINSVQMPNYTYQNGFALNSIYFCQKGIRNYLEVTGMSAVPGSPLARRTKYEVKSAQKLARKYFTSPDLWAKCLLGTCYSLWFIHLPSYVIFTEHKVSSTLRLAYDLLARIQKTGLQPTDEVCYRVMMQLCGAYNQPMLAVKLLFLMKRSGVQPNAITYGFYNRAVLESKWPSDMSNSSQLLWNKLRNVIHATALLKKMGQEAGKRRSSMQAEEISLNDGLPLINENCVYETSKNINMIFGSGSQSDIGYKSSSGELNNESTEVTETDSSVSEQISKTEYSESTNEPSGFSENEDDSLFEGGSIRRSSTITSRDIATFNRFCSRMGSIVKTTGPFRNQGSTINQQQYESSAGLLMTGGVTISNFSENDVKPSILEKNASVYSSPPRIRSNARTKRTRSGSCSESGVSLSPRATRHYPNYYGNQNSNNKPTSHETPDCYQLLTRSESFANDAQILKNLQEIKTQKANFANNDVMNGKFENHSRPGANSSASNYSLNKQPIARKNSLHKLKEYPKCESQNSSAETLPSSGTGSMDDLMVNCNTFVKRPTTNKILMSLSGVGRLNSKIPSEPPFRKTSVCSLEEIRRKEESESLNRVCSSPSLKSPVRTPVTENDPLGALSNEKEIEDTCGVQKLPNLETVRSVSSEIVLDRTGTPILFDRRQEKWDATRKTSHHHSTGSGIDRTSDEDDDSRLKELNDSADEKIISRASTLPADVRESAEQGSPFKTGLGNLSSNFKLPFSPSSLTSKKTNELIMGGLSKLQSAASTMTKKIDEIKEAISTNATPSKDGQYLEDENETLNVHNGVASLGGEETPVKRKISSEFSPSSVTMQLDSWGANLKELFSDGSRKGSTSNLQPLGENSPTSSQQSLALLNERLYPKIIRDNRIPVAVELIMTTCSKCHQCASLIYDEEIMAGWLPEDSNLNTKCPFCDKATVPFLYVSVLDYRSSSEISSRFTSQESVSSSLERVRRKSSFNKLNTSVNSIGGSRASVDMSATEEDIKSKNVHTLEPIVVPYLNPLVLRKELESILNTEGDTSLTRSSFVDEHPIIYWNMVWVFERIAASSHVTGLCLHANSVIGTRDESTFHPSWAECDHRHVLVRTLWDNPILYEEVGYPMYVLWNKNDKESDLLSALLTDNTTIPRSLMERVISSIQYCDLADPIRRVAAERLKLKSHGINHNYSLYRDILFLAFVALGRENIDQSAFDREYQSALESLTPVERDSKMYLRCDNPNLNTPVYFRHYFKELEL